MQLAVADARTDVLKMDSKTYWSCGDKVETYRSINAPVYRLWVLKHIQQFARSLTRLFSKSPKHGLSTRRNPLVKGTPSRAGDVPRREPLSPD